MTDVQTPLKKGETVLYPIMKASKFQFISGPV